MPNLTSDVKVLGIDPGLDRTGWAILLKRGTSAPRLISSGFLHTKAGVPLPQRLNELFDEIQLVIAREAPHCVAVEDIFFLKAARTVAATVQARGVLLLAGAKSGLPVFVYNPRTIKSTLTGNGNALKPQMQKMVQLTLGLASPPEPDDVADAIAIALCHIRRGFLNQLLK